MQTDSNKSIQVTSAVNRKSFVKRRHVVIPGLLCLGVLSYVYIAGRTTSGHDKMLKILDDIAQRTSDEHEFLGQQKLRHWNAEIERLRLQSTPFEMFNANFRLAQAELDQNQLRSAIGHFQTAYELLPAIPFPNQTLQTRFFNRTRFALGTAYLRLGETQNCCLQHSSESCIVPIQGGGLHQRQEGSRQAIKFFLEVLSHPSDEATDQIDVHQAARWLLNIAHLTINTYPDDVPQEHLIPPSFFESEIAFPRFKNVYPDLELNTFNLCGGAIIDDFNNDNYLDIMTCTWDTVGQTQLFVSNRDGTFTEQTESAGLTGFFGGLNCVQADYDNDGDVDVFIVRGAWLKNAGKHPNSLLRNNGNTTFTDVTFEAGLGEFHYPTKTAAWADYDNDGDLDLYIGNESSPECRAASQLFRNNGNGTFTDVAAEAGIAEYLFVAGAVWGDYNNDRFPDLFVSAAGPNRLYRNNRDGTFTDVAVASGVTDPVASFPAWFWDFNNDGNLDLYVGCSSGHVGVLAINSFGVDGPIESPSIQSLRESVDVEVMALYQGDGQGKFQDVAREQNLTYLAQPMGANFGDLNNDGYLDFYLGTGDIQYSEIMPNVMFLNQQGARFTNVTMAGGFGHLQKGHGVAFADLDNDGDQDVYIQMGGAVLSDKFNDALFENPGFGNHWITIQLVGRQSNRCAIGARIRADIVEGDQTRSVYRYVNSGGSFGCNPLRQSIGLGRATKIRTLEIFWPTSNQTQKFHDVAADQFVRIVEGVDRLEPLELSTFTLGGKKRTR